jgi:hypothetical protein
MRHTAIILFLVFFLSASISSFAKTWYVSPQTDQNGWRLQGNGSRENPWDLQTALSGGARAIQPGDTVYIHGGKPYWGYYQMAQEGRLIHAAQLYTSTLKGNEGHPIIVKAYPGERPVLDGGPNTSADAIKSNTLSGTRPATAVLTVTGSYIWIWGLEITNSSVMRQSYYAGGNDLNFAGGVSVDESDHVKLINLIVHDNTSTGISAFSHALNTEIEGCIIYYNGYTAIKSNDPRYGVGNFRKNGPGIYSQNNDDSAHHSKKTIKNNIIFEQFYNGMQIYGSTVAFVERFDILDNTVFNNGLISATDSTGTNIHGDYNILIGGQKDAYNNRINGNQSCFFTKIPTKSALKIGYGNNYAAVHCQANDNIIVSDDENPVFITNPVDFDFKNNLIYSFLTDVHLVNKFPPTGLHKKDFDVNFRSDFNTYLYWGQPQRDGNHYFMTYQRIETKGIEMQHYTTLRKNPFSIIDSVGVDVHSVDMAMKNYRKDKSRSLKVIFDPDDYEPGLAKIVIFNWDSLPQININAGNLIPANNAYNLIDIQNFPEVFQHGNYPGTIALKMAGLKASVPTGLKATPVMVQPEHTDARFGVFWLAYFPYQVILKESGGNLVADFKDVNGREIKNPPFLMYQWKHNGSTLSSATTSKINKPKDGSYELTITDDKGLNKTVKAKVQGGKVE